MAGQLSKACLLFATDNCGAFPDGRFEWVEKPDDLSAPPGSKMRQRSGYRLKASFSGTAEESFQHLFDTGCIESEKLFWSPRQRVQCAAELPDEDGNLTAGENLWDYVAGLNASSPSFLPLLFEASDGGEGKHWTSTEGHPWRDAVAVAYVDGSIEKVKLNRSRLRVERNGKVIDLCAPTPEKNSWSSRVRLAPATPFRSTSPFWLK